MGDLELGDLAAREEPEGDRRHRLLSVVAAVGEGHEGSRRDLDQPEGAVDGTWAHPVDGKDDQGDQHRRDHEAEQR